ncbi:gluconate 2-dehydrogenase subunit 3 family protein [Novosphingobium sp. G106]|uniref:gluconate 2-dehydrogenase subunit 3 family protein n=1 Tax=Novosphingobium sp. G106 TaxID=2849500 RepID=UPI001C2D84F9|nr:gluconate 2-dehydrogenase subunit 3 family protein [Novosphingobium sp. G106]MBV1686689.1 gluconate 2-dehydrogenase subunit 3 family protein [Novosphingobium sp. G106]
MTIPNMDRRSLLESALLLMGVTVTAGFSTEAFAKAAASPKPFLDQKSFTLLSAIADTIIPKTDTPGAVDAHVPAKFDALLVNWASPEHRVQLAGAITKIDDLAREKQAKGFAELTPDQRKELLSAHDTAALKPVPRTDKLTGMRAMMAGPSVAEPGYAKLKELIVLLYYYSEEALTTELVYEHSPGGWTPSVKATPETRATGGLGMF